MQFAIRFHWVSRRNFTLNRLRIVTWSYDVLKCPTASFTCRTSSDSTSSLKTRHSSIQKAAMSGVRKNEEVKKKASKKSPLFHPTTPARADTALLCAIQMPNITNVMVMENRASAARYLGAVASTISKGNKTKSKKSILRAPLIIYFAVFRKQSFPLYWLLSRRYVAIGIVFTVVYLTSAIEIQCKVTWVDRSRCRVVLLWYIRRLLTFGYRLTVLWPVYRLVVPGSYGG